MSEKFGTIWQTEADYSAREKQVIHVDGVRKIFGKKQQRQVMAVNHVSFIALSGEFIIIYGPSGCGKSTLLHMVAGLECPSTGKVVLRGKNIFKMSDDRRNEWRARNIGTLFQRPLWVNTLSVKENVALPLLALGCYKGESLEIAGRHIGILGLEALSDRHPSELSGGETALMGLARAMVADPWLLLLDEPTGNLDSHSAKKLIEMLAALNKKNKKTVLMVTHNLTYLPFANRSFSMQDGSVVKTVEGKDLDEASRMAARLEKVITSAAGIG